ncbi:hypothetical protein PCC8801_1626 [Rippkaea orientalis PCC 8801]|uniref:Uncharacterized protein n=1 Tax=Rippkaea orientalis (strain PCC 8801 / RF-1) TaxID=41431 RepID=B7JVY8_RIPO1|nr:hypothetical protein [Rippkaea orientalis]ACK65677.1 hypothetical protein PCC8801_1626 [Rippkaea orientalis PCC 8801]
MKRSIISIVTFSILGLMTLPTLAEPSDVKTAGQMPTEMENLNSFNQNVIPSEINLNTEKKVASELSPVNLVQLAYAGYFTDLGIPSHGGFKNALMSNKIDEEILVITAIKKGRLSSDTLNNQDYLSIVKTELESQLFN